MVSFLTKVKRKSHLPRKPLHQATKSVSLCLCKTANKDIVMIYDGH